MQSYKTLWNNPSHRQDKQASDVQTRLGRFKQEHCLDCQWLLREQRAGLFITGTAPGIGSHAYKKAPLIAERKWWKQSSRQLRRLSHTRHNNVEASSCPSTCRKQRPYAEEVDLRSEAGWRKHSLARVTLVFSLTKVSLLKRPRPQICHWLWSQCAMVSAFRLRKLRLHAHVAVPELVQLQGEY